MVYGSLWCWPFAALLLRRPKYPRQSMVVHDRRYPPRGGSPGSCRHHAPAESGIADFRSKCSNVVRRGPGRSAKMVGHRNLFRIFTRAGAWRRGNSAVVSNLISEGDEYGE
jgi:hypothetical protein